VPNCRKSAAVWLAAALVATETACSGDPGPDPAAMRAYVEANRSMRVPAAAPAPIATEAAGPPAVPVAAAPEAPAARQMRVTILDGKGLYDADDGFGETDGFVTVEVDGERFKTSVAEGTLEPVWGDSFVFEAPPGAVMTITLFDSDVTTDERLGVVSLALPGLAPGGSEERPIGFRDGAMGTIRLRLEGLESTPKN
jgi:hypothetical protein